MTPTADELRPLLKRLKLGPMLDTLPERIALARRDHLDYADFLQLLLVDEVSRRDHGRLELRLRQAGFEQVCRLEDFDWSASIRLDRRLLDAAFSLQFLDRREASGAPPSRWRATSAGPWPSPRSAPPSSSSSSRTRPS